MTVRSAGAVIARLTRSKSIRTRFDSARSTTSIHNTCPRGTFGPSKSIRYAELIADELNPNIAGNQFASTRAAAASRSAALAVHDSSSPEVIWVRNDLRSNLPLGRVGIWSLVTITQRVGTL
ncbi:hypothetical protein BH10ACT9_BH10ACT9_04280 [soil metagenome]